MLILGCWQSYFSMSKKFRERLDSLDIKSVVLTVSILGTLVFIVYNCSDPVDNLPGSLTTKGKGKILSVTAITQMRQGRRGTNIFTESYKVKFPYQVKGVTYVQFDEIKNIGRNQPLIDKVNSKTIDSLEIIYNDKLPTNCKIYLK